MLNDVVLRNNIEECQDIRELRKFVEKLEIKEIGIFGGRKFIVNNSNIDYSLNKIFEIFVKIYKQIDKHSLKTERDASSILNKIVILDKQANEKLKEKIESLSIFSGFLLKFGTSLKQNVGNYFDRQEMIEQMSNLITLRITQLGKQPAPSTENFIRNSVNKFTTTRYTIENEKLEEPENDLQSPNQKPVENTAPKEERINIKTNINLKVNSVDKKIDLSDYLKVPKITFQNGVIGSFASQKSIAGFKVTAIWTNNKDVKLGAQATEITFENTEFLNKDSLDFRKHFSKVEKITFKNVIFPSNNRRWNIIQELKQMNRSGEITFTFEGCKQKTADGTLDDINEVLKKEFKKETLEDLFGQ